MGLKELIAELKAERAKGDKADAAVIDGLLDDIEPIASRDYATIMRLEKKAAGKSTEDVNALEAQIQALTDERDNAKREADKQVKALSKERDTLKESATQFRDRTHRLMKDDGLRKALVDAGVKKEYLDAAHALLLRDIQVDDEKGEAFAMLAKDGKETRFAIADHVKTWGASEQGKHFIGNPSSSGGGALGSGSHPIGKTMTRAEEAGRSPEEKAAFYKGGGVVTD